MAPKVGILAGTGELPKRLLDACRAQKRDALVITFEGENRNEDIDPADAVCVHLGKVGKVFALLREHGCREVVMAGRFRRPAYSELKLDFHAAKLLPKLLRAGGDDALLRVLANALERQGFALIGVDDLLPSLQVGEGPLGAVAPDEDDRRDITVGTDLLRTIARFDIGQAAIVAGGRILGIEGAEGTDQLIERCAPELSRAGGVLVKMRKPGQDDRIDLPSIGVETIRRCADAGIKGIAVEANAALVIDRDQVVAQADATNLFVVGFIP